MTSLLLLNNFYTSDTIPTSSRGKESDELLYTAARYGPRINCQRKELMQVVSRISMLYNMTFNSSVNSTLKKEIAYGCSTSTELTELEL